MNREQTTWQQRADLVDLTTKREDATKGKSIFGATTVSSTESSKESYKITKPNKRKEKISHDR